MCENKSKIWNKICLRDSLFPRKIIAKIYHTRVSDQFSFELCFHEHDVARVCFCSTSLTSFRIQNKPPCNYLLISGWRLAKFEYTRGKLDFLQN